MRVMTGPAKAGRYFLSFVILALALVTVAAPHAQQPTIILGPFDLILDTYVRDGYVYYRALKSERRRLDEYIRQIGLTDVDNRPKNEQLAFWLNAYNALVLRTVIDNYPAPRRSTEYPPRSIRNVPGAFERL